MKTVTKNNDFLNASDVLHILMERDFNFKKLRRFSSFCLFTSNPVFSIKHVVSILVSIKHVFMCMNL